MFSRRDILATAAAGAAMTTAATAATFGNPDQPAQGAINAKNPAGVTTSQSLPASMLNSEHSSLPDFASQMRVVPSAEVVTTRLPSSDSATPVI